MRILVVGDSCTDIFRYGKVEWLSPEAPVPVIKPTHETQNGGMAKNVKTNLEALNIKVDIVTNKNDIRKIRYIDDKSNQMILRVDENDYCREINKKELKFIIDNEFDAIII